MRYFVRVGNDDRWGALFRFEVGEDFVREAVFNTKSMSWIDSENSIAKALVTGSMDYDEISEVQAREASHPTSEAKLLRLRQMSGSIATR